MFRVLDFPWSRIVTAKPSSGWHGDLLIFNSMEDISSTFTDPITLRNYRGKIWDSVHEKFWSKRKNEEMCHSSSLI